MAQNVFMRVLSTKCGLFFFQVNQACPEYDFRLSSSFGITLFNIETFRHPRVFETFGQPVVVETFRQPIETFRFPSLNTFEYLIFFRLSPSFGIALLNTVKQMTPPPTKKTLPEENAVFRTTCKTARNPIPFIKYVWRIMFFMRV